MAKKRKKQAQQKPLSDKQYIKQRARKLPIYKCLVNGDWKESGTANITILRKHTNGNVTAAFFYVCLFAEGVKDTAFRVNVVEEELPQHLPTEEISYELAHNIIYGAAAYAEDNGIMNAKEFALTQYVLEEDTDDVPLIDVEFGKNGKPFLLINSNRSNMSSLHALNRTLGEGNFNFVYEENFHGNEIPSHENEEEKGYEILFEAEAFAKTVTDNYQYYNFDSTEDALDYLTHIQFYDVFIFLHKIASEDKLFDYEKEFNNLSDINKIRLTEYMYYTEFQKTKMDLKTFIGIHFLDTYPESEFDVEEELLLTEETEADTDNEKQIVEELKQVNIASEDSAADYFMIIDKYPASRKMVKLIVEHFIQKNKPEVALAVVNHLFLKEQNNPALAAYYLMLSSGISQEINSAFKLDVQNIKLRFGESKKYYKDDVLILYSAFIGEAYKRKDIKQAQEIFNALAKLGVKEATEQARQIIALLKKEKIDNLSPQ